MFEDVVHRHLNSNEGKIILYCFVNYIAKFIYLNQP